MCLILTVLLLIIYCLLVFLSCNRLYKNTIHYRMQHPYVRNMLSMRKQDKFDIVNVGSSQLVFGLDYSECDVRADNWAAYPQFFEYDYALFKQFAQHINRGAIVLLPVCVMEFFGNREIINNDKRRYYAIVSFKNLPEYEINKYLIDRYPLLRHPQWVKFILKDIKWEFDGYPIEKNPCATQQDYINDANGFINRWNKGFGTHIPSVDLTNRQKDNIQKNSKVLGEMARYCKKQGWNPVFLLLPATKYLTERFSDEFIQECVVSPVIAADADTPFINYWGRPEYMDTDWYMSSLFMNQKGRRLMTKQVVEDAIRIVHKNG